MAHPIPKELRGEERYFSIPVINLHFSRKGVIYNGLATIISVVIGKLTNVWVFAVLFLLLNAIAYPLAHMRIPKNKFEGGYVPLDRYCLRWFKYKHMNKNLYIRRRVCKD